MNPGPELMRQLVDELEESYVEWRRQSARVWLAYRSWSSAPVGDQCSRYAAYLEELDREKCAGDSYAHAVDEVTVRLWPPRSLRNRDPRPGRV